MSAKTFKKRQDSFSYVLDEMVKPFVEFILWI